jgi:hypothetical protein
MTDRSVPDYGCGLLRLWTCIILCIFLTLGCNALKSRYAMNDPVYAEKYAKGAERGDLLGKAKQAIDARHVEGMGGWYLSGGSLYNPNSDNTLAGGDIGFEHYDQSWFSRRLSAGTYWSGNEGFIAADTGVRAQLPSRLAPFVGFGAMLGFSKTETLADGDGADNDDDDLYDEPGETKSEIDEVLAAVYPEIGLHAWLNSNWRFTAYGRYMLGKFGNDSEDWLVGGQLTYFYRPN